MKKIVNFLGTGENKAKRNNKQTNKQSSLLTLTVSYEKRSRVIRSKKKKKKHNKAKQTNRQKKDQERKKGLSN